MDSVLPEECLVYLISFVALHPPSLHALLLTNKTFFRLVAPILYHNPWNYIGFIQSRRRLSHELRPLTPSQRQARILRLLLTCIPDTLQELPPYRSRATPLPSKPFFDYLSLYSFHSEKLLQNINPMPVAPSPVPPSNSLKSISGYIAHTGRPLNIASIHVGLISHSPQYISTIAFSIHKISIFLPLVNQLSGLSRLELLKQSSIADLSGAHNFIITHRQHFSTLQEIVLNTKDKSDLSSLIQAMETPRIIDVTCWANADQHLTQFPLQQCRTLLMGLRPSQSNVTLDPAILARSPHLKNLRMCVFHRDIFSWAFTRRYLQTAGNRDETNLSQKSASQLYTTNPRLVSVSLYGTDNVLVPALLDACDAFRETLQGLAGLSSFGEPSISWLSWGWDMPCLTRLDLEGTIAVYFDLESLKFCPLLRELRLFIGRKIPPDWDVLHKATQLSRVSSHLRHLDLGGWWALPDLALTQTLLPVLKRLHYLNLMWCTGPTCACLLELMTRLKALTWFGVSAATATEQDDITNLIHTMHLDLEVDIYRLDQH